MTINTYRRKRDLTFLNISENSKFMGNYILAIDIGGTNTRFCLFQNTNSNIVRINSEWVTTNEFSGFKNLLSHILSLGILNDSLNFESVVFAAAGPVTSMRYCDPPNIPWAIDLEEAKTFFSDYKSFNQANLYLINDFIAQGFSALSELGSSSIEIKVSAKGNDGVAPEGTIAIIGPGTGLGKAMLVKDQTTGKYIGVPSEGGHSLFPVCNKEELSFYEFAAKKLNISELTFENVVCGQGLSLFYEYFESKELKPAEVAKIISDNNDHPVVGLYANFFARACKAFCLESYATGGLYIMGGVVGKNPFLVQNNIFKEEFERSNTMSKVLKSIEIRLISNQESGLYGAAFYALTN